MDGVRQEPSPLVLIVDDFADIREAYTDFLEFRGYRVATAADGFQAIAQAQALLPALIVMDLSLPGMDGWEATRRIKADERTRHIHVLALTGHVLDDAEAVARAAGCEGFLAKPCLLEDVAAEVRRILGIDCDPRDRW